MVLLTKNGCPKCEQIKMFIEKALTKEQKEKIEIIKKEDQESIFLDYVNKYHILSLPVIIDNNKLFINITNSTILNLLNKN